MKLSLFLQQGTNSMLAEDISTNQINFQAKEKPMKDGKSFLNLGTNAINELELKVDVSNKDDVEQLSTILVELLSYPNSEMADVHADAMRLGNYDLEKKSQNRNDTTTSLLDENGGTKVCPCCGFIKQTDTINLCTPFEDIKNMGVSTFLYFSNYKKLSILLLIMTIIYSAYALITNVLASRNGSLANIQTSVDYIAISLSSKETNDNPTNRMYYFVQCWLGLATIVVWIFVLAYLKFNEIKSILDYDNDTISCSDYSVVMEGIPLDVTLVDLQRQLKAFYDILEEEGKVPVKWKKPLTIAKINIGKPFYLNEQSFKDQEITNITKEIQETKQALINLIIQRRSNATFTMPKEQRTELYQKYRGLLKRKADKLLKMADNIKQSLKEESDDQLTTIFVTFQSNIPKTFLSYLHQPSVLGRIQSICGKSNNKFWYQRDGKNYQLEIRRAPEPQDIIWTNLGQNNCNTYLRKLFTFTVTMILLGICFAIVYGLSRAQEDAGGSRTISIAISLTISIVNIMLGQVIRRLTVFERDYTETYRQGSLAVKSVIAQMINTILIPIITAFYVKDKNLYYQNGLVDNIFMLSVSTIIVPPIVLFVNPLRILTAILRCFNSRPTKKLYQNQKEHNILQEGVEFQVGYQSIYPVSVFMFVCFFVSLQPIISVVAMIGYFLMYWVQKYSLFNRYRRPVPGTEFVNNVMYKMISLGPIVYSFGSLTWANFSPNGIPPEAIVPNLIALGVSVILFIIPFNSIIVGLCMSESAQKPTLFDDDRIFMPSEYDRLNPDTQADGCEDYKKYMQKKRDQIKNMNQEQKDIFAKKMMINVQRGQMFNQARPQQGMNYNYFQPQPQQQMMGYDFARMMAPNSMPYMGFAPYNPMGSSLYQPVYGFPQQPMAPPIQQAPPVMSVPQNVRPPQYQNSGFGPNYQPQANPINTLISHSNPPANINQVGSMSSINQNPFTNNQIFPPAAQLNQPQPPFGGYPNIPNYNPNNPFPGNQPQGRRW